MEYGIVVGAGPIRGEKVQPYDAMGQCDFGNCMHFARGFIGAHRLGVADDCGELSEKNEAIGRAFNASLPDDCSFRFRICGIHPLVGVVRLRGGIARRRRERSAGGARGNPPGNRR